jgi:hypothetical protein
MNSVGNRFGWLCETNQLFDNCSEITNIVRSHDTKTTKNQFTLYLTPHIEYISLLVYFTAPVEEFYVSNANKGALSYNTTLLN